MRHSRSHLLLFVLAALGLLVAQGCTKQAVIGEIQFEPLYGEVVDSIVVEPFSVADELKTSINSTQLQLFQEMLISQLETNPQLRVFEEPPTKLPNTLIIQGRLAAYEVEDLPGEEFFLRNIHMTVDWRFRTGDESSTSRQVRRKLTLQKIYPPDTPVPALEFDLHNAIGEITDQIAEIMYPTTIEGGISLADGTDPDNGDKLGHPMLVRGNQMAADGRFKKAAALWRLVLFDPTQPEDEELFRVSRRTLLLLADKDVDEDTIERLRGMLKLDPEDLLDFRDSIREALGGFRQIEPTILKLADHHRDTRHLNMAAAHRNLAVLYWIYNRFDLVSYHLARAQANYPTEEILEKWTQLQETRDGIPVEFTSLEAIGMYMRIPSPRSAKLAPGLVENALFPPVVFETNSAAAPPPGLPASAAAPATGSAEDAPLQPVELAPPSDSGGTQDPGLPPIQFPEQAGG